MASPLLQLGVGVSVSSGASIEEALNGAVSVTGDAGTTITVIFTDSDGHTVIKTLVADGTTQVVSLNPSDLGGSTGLHDGTITVRATQEASGIPIATDPSLNFLLDTIAPTIAISTSDSRLTIGETALITFTFSNDPGLLFIWDEDVAATYLEVNGGTLSNFSGADAVRTATFTPTPGVDAGSASISVKAGLFTDAAGNTSTAAGPLTFAFDTQAPGLTIISSKATLLAGDTAQITFRFSEPPAAFSASHVSVSGGALSDFTATADPRADSKCVTGALAGAVSMG